MHLGTPKSAIISAIIFNALIIPALVPLALKGVRYRAIGATALLRRNLLIYGLGGVILPFIGIKRMRLIRSRIRTARDDAGGGQERRRRRGVGFARQRGIRTGDRQTQSNRQRNGRCGDRPRHVRRRRNQRSGGGSLG